MSSRPVLRLAYGGPSPALALGLAGGTGRRPALLVSMAYLRQFEKERPRYEFRDWVLDSGAFSVFNKGEVIDLEKYMRVAKAMRATDSQLSEVFALDVIGDWRGSLRNTEAMWAAGIAAVPCYHYSEPEDVLRGLARDYPKIALGGAIPLKGGLKLRWAEQCFARVWPKRIHGFGFGGEEAMMALPFESVDASNWESGPLRFGNWRSFGKGFRLRGGNQNLRAEVEYMLDLEARVQFKWASLWDRHAEALACG